MIRKTIEFMAELIGLRKSSESNLAPASFTQTAVLPIDSLRFSPAYQDYVLAPKVRAMELVIHLRNKYGDDWKQHIGEIRDEPDEVRGLLCRLEYEMPDVSMTSDNVPELFDGFHTVCAYRNSGYSEVEVLLGRQHTKTSAELDLRPLNELTVYSHL